MRHWLTTLLAARTSGPFPWGTFLVNVIGSAIIGFVLALPDSRLSPVTRQFLSVGFLGGFTTFSAFSAQTFHLINSGKTPLACAYAIVSVISCLAACWLCWQVVQVNR